MTREEFQTKEEECKKVCKPLSTENATFMAKIISKEYLTEVAFWANELSVDKQKKLVNIIKKMLLNN